VQVNFLNPQPPTKPDTVQMTYDGMGRRVGITELHGTTTLTAKTFVWSGTQLCQERDSTGHTVAKQFFNQGEQIGGTNYYYPSDYLGSVRQMTDSSGAVHANYDYDIYGRQTKLSGDLDSDYGYAGLYAYKTLCLDLTWFRAYDPEKGRWLTRDPIGEILDDSGPPKLNGPNLYAYVSDNPLRFIDPLGLAGVPMYIPCLKTIGGDYVWPFVEGLNSGEADMLAKCPKIKKPVACHVCIADKCDVKSFPRTTAPPMMSPPLYNPKPAGCN
jgi:RHS repeat-associated protein